MRRIAIALHCDRRKGAGALAAEIIILLIATTVLVLGVEELWWLFGDPDLGPVSFELLDSIASEKHSHWLSAFRRNL